MPDSPTYTIIHVEQAPPGQPARLRIEDVFSAGVGPAPSPDYIVVSHTTAESAQHTAALLRDSRLNEAAKTSALRLRDSVVDILHEGGIRSAYYYRTAV